MRRGGNRVHIVEMQRTLWYCKEMVVVDKGLRISRRRKAGARDA